MNEYNKLTKIIDNYDMVSFDIFDTLLLRNVQKPIDIFALMENKIAKLYGITDFQKMRIKAERDSRCEENKYETTLNEIYDKLPIEEKIKEEIKKMELAMEKEFLIANPFMLQIYNYCLEKNKKIVCITDMYLPLEFLEEILKKNGYKNVKIYLSCVYHKHKGNMTLYEEVYDKEKVSKDKWLHIGDNYYSDYTQALNFGINAYHYVKVLDRSINKEAKSLGGSILLAISNNWANNGLEIPYWTSFGYLYASLIHFGFSHWLYNELKDEDNIYFLARDGYIIKKIMEEIKKVKNAKQDYYYLYTSRRAIQLPLTYYDSKKEAIETLTCINSGLGQKLDVNKIFSYFDLDIKKYQNILDKYHFKENDEIDSDEDILRYKQLVSEIYPDIQKKMLQDISLIKEYLQEENIQKYSRINIVDIGWRGSVQQALQKVSEKEIFGYYLATSYVYDDIYYNTKGYILNYNNPLNLADVVYPNIPMYEFLFSAPEGTLIGFKKNGKKVEPILKENTDYSKEIAEVQEASLDIITTFVKYYDYLDDLAVDDVLNPYQYFLENKNFLDLQMFNKLKSDIGYADNSISFVKVFTKEEIEKNYSLFLEKITKSLWNKAFLVEGINNQEELTNYKLYLDKKFRQSKFTNYLKMAIKHPFLTFKKVLKKIINKISR